MLSPGFLHSAFRLLELLNGCRASAEDITDNFRRILLAAPQYVIDISLRCGWVSVDTAGYLVLTNDGMSILAEQDDEIRLRRQIKDYIFYETPSWAGLVPRGRHETVAFLPVDVRQCFFEAGLLKTPPTEEIIAWWDELAAAARSKKFDVLGKIGRNGEKLSFDYEKKRVGRIPIWQSVESNLSGYDILSWTSCTDDRTLMIEVKATTENIETALFHISRNEWETAAQSDNYILHLWTIKKEYRLATVSKEELAEHIPSENGCGKWESASIPFKCFGDQFTFIEL